MMTRLAGKFTPEDSVEVATRTRKMPFLNAPSTMSRSSKVRPEKVKSMKNLNRGMAKMSLARVVICCGEAYDFLEVLIEAGGASPKLLENLYQF